jgi:hypothetical protein
VLQATHNNSAEFDSEASVPLQQISVVGPTYISGLASRWGYAVHWVHYIRASMYRCTLLCLATSRFGWPARCIMLASMQLVLCMRHMQYIACSMCVDPCMCGK